MLRTELGPMQRVRLGESVYSKGYLMRFYAAYLPTLPPLRHNIQLSSCVGCVCVGRLLAWFCCFRWGATTTCCRCHCRHLFLINFNCFHFVWSLCQRVLLSNSSLSSQKKLFQFQRKISQKQIKSRAPESISTLLLSYNIECFLALKFPLRIFSLPPGKDCFPCKTPTSETLPRFHLAS